MKKEIVVSIGGKDHQGAYSLDRKGQEYFLTVYYNGSSKADSVTYRNQNNPTIEINARILMLEMINAANL